jgi:hypothetical protein
MTTRPVERSVHELMGGCHCGNVVLLVELSQPPESYSPRACDCDFCCKHAAAYVSDPRGSLTIRIRDARLHQRYRQGSGQAECLLCTSCGVYVAALYQGPAGSLYGTVNIRALQRDASFAAAKSVSPKLLSESEKVERWRTIWFAGVALELDGR